MANQMRWKFLVTVRTMVHEQLNKRIKIIFHFRRGEDIEIDTLMPSRILFVSCFAGKKSFLFLTKSQKYFFIPSDPKTKKTSKTPFEMRKH